jgi:hypothetical protein
MSRPVLRTLALAAFLASPPQLASAGAPVSPTRPCRFATATSGIVGDSTIVGGDLVANAEGGRLILQGGVRMREATTVLATDVTLGAGTSVDFVAAEVLTVADAEIRGSAGSLPSLPLEDPFCAVAAENECDGAAVGVGRRSGSGPLAPGAYSRVVVRAGATLVLAPGEFRICSLRLAHGARLVTSTGDATSIRVREDIGLGRGAFLGPEFDGVPPVVELSGSRARVGTEARFEARLAAPAARLRVGRDATLFGGTCSQALSVRRGGRLDCHEPSCGDQRFDAATEQCEGAFDAACPGTCQADCTCPAEPGPWRFVDVTETAGAVTRYAPAETVDIILIQLTANAGGVAAGDYDGDGWIDLFTVGGAEDVSRLLRNKGDGTFEDLAEEAGLLFEGLNDTGPSFADIDGDGDLDLVVGGLVSTELRLFLNGGDGTFADATAASGLTSSGIAELGTSFGDFDLDGDLDLFVSHWFVFAEPDPPFRAPVHLWRNEGGGTFTPATDEAELVILDRFIHYSFTATFADVSEDGLPDLMLASDFGTEQYFLADGDGTFTEATNAVNTAENAMGQALFDFDNDGDLDWFITSIWDPDGAPEQNWGTTGNRLYRNEGDGGFTDVTEEAGIREGFWGWGACAADFDLDGDLDLFHVNGYAISLADTTDFDADPSRLFVNAGDGTFTERSLELGIDDRGQGRGVVCFDYDRDGDVDLFVANGQGQDSRLFRNDLPGERHFLQVRLAGRAPNTQAAGARVFVTASGVTQMREIHIGSNYLSQDPALAHFGLGASTVVDELRVRWPDATETVLADVAADQFLTIEEP